MNQATPSRLGDFFAILGEPRARYSDRDIQEISCHLQSNGKQAWSQVPRLYTILRTIGQLHIIDALIEQGISDYWFPFDTKSVPTLLSSSMQYHFLESQSLVLTKAVDLEKNSRKQHAHFGREDVFPFEIGERLGSGGYGTVDKVLSHFSHREFARKRFARKKGGNKRDVQSFLTELQVLKRLQHRHCVELVGYRS